MAFEDNKGKKDRKALLERCFRLLEYMRINTDKEHPVIQARLRKDPDIKDFLGTNETFNETVTQLAKVINSGGSGIKPEEEWRLVYKAFSDYYGENSDDAEKMSTSVKDIYFNHIFTNDEVTAIINSLRMSKAVDKSAAETIIAKLKRELCSKFYREPVYRLNSREFTDTATLAENITRIQNAISTGRQISFIFNYCNQNRILVPVTSKRHSVSPHYIVSDNGKLYLFGGFDNDELCVYRIDLMTDIRISKLNGKPIRASEKFAVRGLPLEMSDEYRVKHLYMSFENAITAEFEWTKRQKSKELNCTILHSVFGDNFEVIKDNIVRVRASEWGLVNFAFQYSEYVKVISPDPLLKKIEERVRDLNNKYL